MLKQITMPNFFILGAAKSGTTLLYHTLKQHPDIFLTSIKEPGFLCEHVEYFNNPADYFELFDAVKDEKIIGEASHIYMSDPKAARIIKALSPNAKFVVTLRNPADRAYSMYLNLRRDGFEFNNRFEKALRVEDKRLNSVRFKKDNPKFFWNYLYFHSGLYGEQLKRYFALFDKEQFHIITLNQLKNNFEETIKGIFHFLDIDENMELKLKKEAKNTGNDIRFFLIQRLRRKLPREYRKYIQFLVDSNKIKAKPINPATKSILMERYENDLRLLYELTGIDLTE